MSACPECKRPTSGRLDQCCYQAGSVDCLQSQLAAALTRAEAAELENRTWRELAEWERYTNDRAVSMEDCGMRKHGDPARISA